MLNLFCSVKEEGKYVTIKGLNQKNLVKDIRKRFKTSKISNVFELISHYAGFSKSILIHKFFLPEFVFILLELPRRSTYSTILNLIYSNTWLANTTKSSFIKNVDFSVLSKMNYNLKSFQKEFIELYDKRKQQYDLKGFILGFEQGLGKTFTSLALMETLHKNAVIIIAPKSTLKTVWKNEIIEVFGDSKSIWVIGDIPKEANYYIVNYESIEKLDLILKNVHNKNLGLIVDECHNFRNVNAKRVKKLKNISNITNCKDILLLSGTPIKALGSEMIPVLSLLDPYFDNDVQKIFIKSFGLSTSIANHILRNRLGLVMHRKLKSEVLSLPSKTEYEIKIKIPNGKKFTLKEVKKEVADFIEKRQKFYKETKNDYVKDFDKCLNYLENKLGNNHEFKRYLKILKLVRKHGYIKELKNEITWMNNYEKENLRSLLTNELKHKFDKSRAVIKYVNLKIMGEVIGGLLNKLRAEMFREMIKHSKIDKIINDSEKKTVLFTTFVDVAKFSYDFLKSKYTPLIVFGETSKNIKTILFEFKNNPKINPLIATIQTLSTGVTLVEANTVIFLNQPWRHTDKLQAQDRVHRIGQDTDVFIYVFSLDTGVEPNLSTRMDDIVSWSKEMFVSIVGPE